MTKQTLFCVEMTQSEWDVDFLDLDEALTELELHSAEHVEIGRLRFFLWIDFSGVFRLTSG
jgi:hypothetical protein